MADFFEMGGHGAYVWSAYAAFAIALGGLAIWSMARNRRMRETLEETERLRRQNPSQDRQPNS